MRIISLLSFLLFIACSSTSNEQPNQELANDKQSSTRPALPELEWSKLLGHFFKYIPYDTFRYELHEVSKIYYDIRYGENSLVVMKCQDYSNCGDKFNLIFGETSGDTIIFQFSETSAIPIRTWRFYQNSVLVHEFNDSTQNWESVRYDAFRPIDD